MMKQKLTLLILMVFGWSLAQAQITLPYSENLETEATGGISCGNQQVFTTINWTNDLISSNDWVIDNNGTGSGNTGPTANGGADHNPGASGGKYLYFETSSPCNVAGQTAAIVSDEIYTTGTEPNLFFEFWYHQFGADIADIVVNTRIVTAGVAGPWVQLDSLYTAPPGLDAWQLATNDISTLIGDTFQIQIIGTTGNGGGSGWESDYALDDFNIFSILANDAGITSIDGPTSPAPGGVNNVAVSVTNFGANNLTSATVNWDLNGVLQTPFAYTGPGAGLPTNSSEGGVVIGTANFVTGIFNITAWTSLPNGIIDSVMANDTARLTGCGGALRGSFTAGGVGADFPNMADLSFVLSTCGIDSHTVINVNPGFYSEQLVLTTVPGTADTATLTIDGGNAATTTLSTNSLAAVIIDGTTYTTIKNLTLESSAATDAYGVHLTNAANFNTIDSCIINLNDSTTNLNDVIGVSASSDILNDFGEGDNANHTTVSNCTITGGEYGIHFEGAFATRNVGNTFINNTLINNEDYGIYCDDQDSLSVIGNTITGLRNINADGIYVFDLEMFEVSGNLVVDAPDYGIWIDDGNAAATPVGRAKIINNMVTSTGDRAMYLNDVHEADVFHNTVASSGISGTNGAMYVNDLLDVDMRNNIFYCDGAFALYSLDDLISVGANTVDYNIYYTTGPNLIDAGPTVHADLVSWQTAQVTLNMNSLEMQPLFLGGLSDLHLFAPADNNLGDNTAGVLVDIDGDARPAGANVDIGADEFTPLQDDAGVSAVENPISPATVGLNDVIVSVSNFGADTLAAATIEWELDGIAQTPYAHTDSLLSGDTRTGIIIGSTTVTGGGVFTVKAWTVMPNGVADIQNANDTTEITGCGALRGVYTAGGVGADFVDMATLSFVLSNCGIDSHTVININPGFYAERLVLESVPGTADTITLTINGGSAATTTLSNDNFSTIFLNGTSYTTIKNLTLEAIGTVDVYGVQLRGSANFNTIDSCIVMMNDSSTNLQDVVGIVSSDVETFDTGEGDNANWTTVSNCTIMGGEKGIHFEGANANRNVGNMASNNTLMNQEDYGIDVDDQDSLTIEGNTISGLRSAFADAIYCFDIMMFNISENLALEVPDYGIYVADGNFDAVPTSRGQVNNNMVTSTSDRALYFDDVNETDVFHNTIAASITGTFNGAFYTNDIVDLDVRNNIFYGDGGFAYYSADALTAVMGVFDYNNYYSNGPNLVDAGPVYLDLTAWQAGQAFANANSVEGDPIFVNGLVDAHVLGPVANDVGDMTVGILVDVDGDVRPEGPIVDMGADEFTPKLLDAVAVGFTAPATVCGDSNTVVRVIIRNLGLTPITSLPVTVNYAGPSSGTLNATYTGSLAFGAFDTVVVGTINTYEGGTFAVDGFVSLVGDEDLSSDTLPAVTVSFTPFVPQGMNAVSCGLDSALISAVPYLGAGYFWYASNDPLDTIPVGSGNDFLVPSVVAQDTYYLGYANNSDSLSTTYFGGNGSDGNMFDVVALNTVTVTNMAMAIDAGAATVEIWYKSGSHVGFETNGAAWTQAGVATPVVSAGSAAGTFIPIDIDITIPAGQSYSFFVVCTAGGNEYTNGISVGNVWAANADMEILEGVGRGPGLFGSSVFTVRNFNGTVYYGAAACSDIRTAVSVATTPGVSVDLGSDTVLCGTSLDLDAGSNADFYAWSNSDTTQVSTVTASGTYDVLVSDSVGCEAVDTIGVVINTPPTVSLGGDQDICGTDAVTLDAGALTPVDYLWSTTDTAQTLDVSADGTYSVVVTDSVGCEATDSMTLTYLPDGTLDTAATVCGAYAWIDGNTYVNDTVVDYILVGQAANGCDSVITLDLDVTIVDTSVNTTVATMTANAVGVLYQWVDCDNGNAPIAGATAQSYTATANGNYAVEITDNGCTQMSGCINLTGLSIRAFGDASLMNLYPNPTENAVIIDFGSVMSETIVTVYTVDGRVMQANENVDGQMFNISLENYPAGMYFVEVTSKEGTVTTLKVSKF